MPDLTHSIVSATRLHLPPSAVEIPEATCKHLCAYVKNAQHLGVVAAIAVNSHEDAVRRVAAAAAPGLDLHVLHVPCWGAFVPALNALLEFAQRKGMTHILYQSLEVQCSPQVLKKMLDHFDHNVLVAGPVLPGHTFSAGEQTLNGRTTPWNTLALWSVRKLALTGFLRIADGLSKSPQDVARSTEGEGPPLKRQRTGDFFEPDLLGSKGWWGSSNGSERFDADYDVPAGVEEVTAIALLQHLLGRHRAVAVLLELPRSLYDQGISWKTNWGGDEARKQWHEYKMKSKVARPNAQLQELFRSSSFAPGSAEAAGETEHADASANFGTVLHVGSTIPPATQLQCICLGAVGIFYFNSTAVLASAFQYINAYSRLLMSDQYAYSMGNDSVSMMTFIGVIIGGVYILMPVSLQLTRMLVSRYNHIAGFLFFGCVLLASHLCIIISQLAGSESTRRIVLMTARIAQGLVSGVPFQSRFVLASLSTGDLHTHLQACAFIAGDLGLGLGALLPAATSALGGLSNLQADTPELWPAITQAAICSVFVVWVLVAFPRHLHFLPDSVRFTGQEQNDALIAEPIDHGRQEAAKFRKVLLISGTARVFVQSAIMPTIALLMYDAQWTGQFRQSIAVATLYLLQLPFEALASRVFCVCAMRAPGKYGMTFNRVLLGSSMAVFSIVACASVASEGNEKLQLLFRHLMELAGLIVTLAVASPFNASRLYQLHDAERAIVTLEFMKAYIGRLLGPFIAVLIYTQVGYDYLLSLLFAATCVVAMTA